MSLEPGRQRVLDDFPYPVALPYSLVFDLSQPASVRRWTLCFTQYQVLRMVTLPLVGQYLEAEELISPDAETIRQLNSAIAAIRAPFFSDWIELAYSARKHLPKVGIEPFFPGLRSALDSLGHKVAVRPLDQRGRAMLNPLEAILALRNKVAHGGLFDEAEAAEHIVHYLPVLHDVLEAFDFLGDHILKVRCEGVTAPRPGHAWIRNLRGAAVGDADPIEEPLADALERAFRDGCETVLMAPDGRVAPLYPLAKPLPDQVEEQALPESERLFLYDGHYGRPVQAKPTVERSYINYLGIHHRAADAASCDRLKERLERRKISFLLDKADTAPWTIADNAADFSRRTLADLRGSKYFPECYVPFDDLEAHFQRFLGEPIEKSKWPRDTTSKRFVNGLVLAGLAGAGKTAFLARQVERLLEQPDHLAPHENPNLVLFLRGQAVLVRPTDTGVALFHDIAEKLGVALEGSAVKHRKEEGFTALSELLADLHAKWKEDKLEGRRLILVLDALNEAPYTENVVKEAIALIELAACYPWLKVVASLRQEWLGVFAGKLEPQEADPIEAVRPFLYTVEPEPEGPRLGRRPPPVVAMRVFDAAQARRVYEHYQAHRRVTSLEPGEYRLPACATPWESVEQTTRDEILVTPLHLHLFMEAFDGRAAEPVATKPELFRHYINEMVRDRPGLDRAIETVVTHLLGDLNRGSASLADDDVHALARAWEAAHSAGQIRLLRNPVETLVEEGLIRKRDTEEGAAYGFVFQEVADYLIYRHLALHRSRGEAELAYWTRCAAHEPVFPEYAGAFGFLLRDWAEEDKLGLAAQIVETSPRWFDDVVVTFLREQAELGHLPGQASPRATSSAAGLSAGGGRWSADVLDRAAYDLMSTHLAPEAIAYFRASLSLHEALWKDNPRNFQIGYGLGSTLTNLGVLLRSDGRVGPAEDAYRRSALIYEALWKDNPRNVQIGYGLGLALNNLGALLSSDGRVRPAEDACRRSALIYEALWKDNPRNVQIGNGLGNTLTNLGLLLRSDGLVRPAEDAYCRSVEIREALWKDNPRNVQIGDGLGMALNNLANLLRSDGRVRPAEDAYRRSALIYEALWKDNPRNVQIGCGLDSTLYNLGLLLRSDGRVRPAEDVYRRSVEILEALWQDNPRNVQIGDGLGRALNNLGNLLRSDGRVRPAEDAYRRSALIYEALWKDNPEHVEVTAGYAGSLCTVGRWDEAQQRVDEVLAKVPRHPHANQLKQYITAKRPVTGAPLLATARPASTPTRQINGPWWKRWLGGK
jgi:tetratricopeptide (TPR) repeat protein